MAEIEEEIAKLERDERALERFASALERLAMIAEKWYAITYPEKPVARDATLTVVQTRKDAELAETIQGTEETLEEWKDIGPREAAFLKRKGS